MTPVTEPPPYKNFLHLKITSGYKTHHDGVIKFEYRVWVMSASAVVCEKWVEEWPENTALGDANAEDDGGGDEISKPGVCSWETPWSI